MSALEFLQSGGMASIGGDLSESSRRRCNDVLRKLATAIRWRAEAVGVRAADLPVLHAPWLFVGEDAVGFSFVFAVTVGNTATKLLYRDLSAHGFLLLNEVVHQVATDDREVVWSCYLAKSADDHEIVAAAHQYVDEAATGMMTSMANNNPPRELQPWIERFRKDHPVGKKTAFLVMRFSSTPAHTQIVNTVTTTLAKLGIVALRADEKDYAEDLFPNVRTYMHCCDFGIAVFERLTTDDFNPNVSLEVGYMMALAKPVCLLKDRTLRGLPTDLVGKLYKSFDPQQISASLPAELERWLKDRDLVSF